MKETQEKIITIFNTKSQFLNEYKKSKCVNGQLFHKIDKSMYYLPSPNVKHVMTKGIMAVKRVFNCMVIIILMTLVIAFLSFINR